MWHFTRFIATVRTRHGYLLKTLAMRLADKSIVITGATGMAEAGAIHASREGARVFVISRGEDECADLVERIGETGGEAGWFAADLTVESEAEEAFASAAGFLGTVDGLFAVAGGSGRAFGDGPAHDVTIDAWEQTTRLNTHPMFLATRSAIRLMRANGGSIVVVGSVLSTSPAPDLFATHAYAAAKGAANAFVTATAAYYARDRIRVNAILPGLVRTPMSERAASDPETVAYSARKQPLASGFLEPDAVAAAAVFLLSDEAAMITGQSIAVDGGWSVTEP